MPRFEYKFVRLGGGFMGVRKEAKETYQQVIQEHARGGWRLVQIFAPAIVGYGASKFYEMIFERQA